MVFVSDFRPTLSPFLMRSVGDPSTHLTVLEQHRRESGSAAFAASLVEGLRTHTPPLSPADTYAVLCEFCADPQPPFGAELLALLEY